MTTHRMRNGIVRTVLLATLALAVLLGGCLPSGISVTQYCTLDTMHIQGSPYAFSTGRWLWRISRSEFIAARSENETTYVLEKYDTTLRRHWRTDFSVPEWYGGSFFRKSGTPYAAQPREVPLRIFNNGRALVHLSTRIGASDDDSVYAIARTFDAATGTIAATTVLASTRIQGDINAARRHYLSIMSPDSTYLLLYSPDNNGNPDSCVVHLHLFHADLSPAGNRTVPIGPITALQAIRVDNLGDVVGVTLARPDTLIISRIAMEGGKGDSTIRVRMMHPANPDGEIHEYVADFVGSNDLAVMAQVVERNELVGIALIRVATVAMQTLTSRTYAVTDTLRLRILGTSAFGATKHLESPSIHSVFVTDDTTARYLLVSDGSWAGPPTNVGEAVITRFDDSLRATANIGARAGRGFGVHTLRDGRLRIVTWAPTGLVIQQVGLDSTGRLPNDYTILFRTPLDVTTTASDTEWFGDSVGFFYLGQGPGKGDWSLCRLRLLPSEGH